MKKNSEMNQILGKCQVDGAKGVRGRQIKHVSAKFLFQTFSNF
jgi:hypothetical protein